MTKCARPECMNEAVKVYCSRRCANLDKDRMRRIKYESSRLGLTEKIPSTVVDFFKTRLGSNADVVLNEISLFLEDKRSSPVLGRILTDSDALVDDFSGTYSFNTSPLSFEKIEKMLRNGQLVFGIEMKKSWVRSALRNDRSWDVECENREIADLVDKNMQRIFSRYSNDFLDCLVYGSYFGEKVFALRRGSEIGLVGPAATKEYVVYDKILSVNPATVDRIVYKGDGKIFDGFVQISPINRREIHVPSEYSLVIPYRPRFGNLWGRSILEPVYPLWVWYEITYRAWVRYMERMGMPVTVCYAPSRGMVRTPEGDTVRAMQYAYVVASNVSRSNAVAIPSDVDQDSHSPLWKIEYLTDSSGSGAKFQQALSELGLQMLRAMVISDRAIAQPVGESSSYAASRQHFAVTMLHNEQLLQDIINYLNQYALPQLSHYNFGREAPVARIVTEGLDPDERDKIFSLFNTLGNQAGGEALDYIDWRRVMEVSNIPTLTDEEVMELRKRRKESETETDFLRFSGLMNKGSDKEGRKNGKIEETGDQTGSGEKLPETAASRKSELFSGVFLTQEQLEELAEGVR